MGILEIRVPDRWPEDLLSVEYLLCNNTHLMPKFSEAFGIDKSQAELDFVDIPLHTDV